MEVRSCGGCKSEVSRQCRKSIEIGGADTRDRDLDGFAAGFAKLAEQTSQRATREAISMRVGEHHSGARRK